MRVRICQQLPLNENDSARTKHIVLLPRADQSTMFVVDRPLHESLGFKGEVGVMIWQQLIFIHGIA